MSDDRKDALAKVVKRIEQLLAKATSLRDTAANYGDNAAAAYEAEAMQFMNKVQELLAEHNLTMDDLGKGDDIPVIRDGDFITWFAGYTKPLFSAVARMYFCGYFFKSFEKWEVEAHLDELREPIRKLFVGSRSRTYLQHHFIGEKHNVIVARYMCEHILAAMEAVCRVEVQWKHNRHTGRRILDRHGQPVPETSSSKKSEFRYKFMNGCQWAICERIAERLKATQDGTLKGVTNLPALRSLHDQAQDKVSDFMNANFDVKQKKSMVKVTADGAVLAGFRAGQGIGLDQQVANPVAEDSHQIAGAK